MRARFAAVVIPLSLLVAATGAQAQRRARITASTMDSAGNVYVTGWRVTSTSPSLVDIVTLKYDKAGTLKWSHAYPNNVALPDTEGWGIAADRFGNVYVAGHSGAGGNVDCLLIKYPYDYEQGNAPEWVRTYDGASRNDQNWSIATDPDGYVYVTGYSAQPHDSTLRADVVTMKYDSSGSMLWGTPGLYNGPLNGWDEGFAVVVDPVTRNVYVTGGSPNGIGYTSADIVTIMYNSSGVEQWVRRYSGPVNRFSRGTSIAVDAAGSAYVAGWSQGTGSIDYVTIKYDVGGNEVWVARYDGPAGANDQPAPPAGGSGYLNQFSNYVQNNQGIIVTSEVLNPVPAVEYLIGRLSGVDVAPGIRVSLVVKLKVCLESLRAGNADLRENARHLIGAFVNEVQALVAAKLISEGEAGELLSVAKHISRGILGTASTVVYVAGQSTGVGTGVDFAIVKYDADDGRPMWNLPNRPGTTPAQPGNPPNVALRYDGPANNTDRVWGMAIDMDGHIYVTGPSMEAAATGVDYFTIKYSVNTYQPEMLANARYNGPGNGVDQPCGFATWYDPASGKNYIFRDPITNLDYIGVTGNITFGAADHTNEYGTVMYDGQLQQLWIQRYY